MKLKSLIFVGLLAWTSCANQSQPFFIERFYPLGPGCDIATGLEAIAGNGYLDVAAGSAQFFVGVRVTGAENITQSPVTLGSTTLERANRDRPIVTSQVVTYRLSKRVGAVPKPYITNVNLPFSTSGEIVGAIQLISPELATSLFDGLTPSSTIDDFVDIQADVEFKGEFTGTRMPFTTGVLTYPIRAFRSNPAACTNGYVKFPVDATSGAADFCDYVGQSTTQLISPPAPTCCTAAGPAGGGGC